MELEKGSMVTVRLTYPIIRSVADVTSYIIQVNMIFKKKGKLFFEGTATFAKLRRLIGCHTKNGELCKKDSRILAVVLH